MEFSEMDSASSFTIFGTDDEPRLPQRMILHVYRVSGILDAQNLFFWEAFRAANPDIEMSPQNLRDMFFNKVINVEEHYQYINDEVKQYLNPTFNHCELDNLEPGDLIEADDFLLDVPKHVITDNLNFEEMAEYVTVPFTVRHNLPIIPLDMHTFTHSECSMSQDDFRENFDRILSQLLVTEEKGNLTAAEVQEKVVTQTEDGISLQHRSKPGVIVVNFSNSGETVRDSDSRQNEPFFAEFSFKPKRITKRGRSIDDSEIVCCPKKRSRVVPSKIQQRRLRRLYSAPDDS
ncbi:uncharacterized protein LOC129718884 [Wyeomyia smithii]|uniref:uncharacterized protein LOC129718884 n=1 Tax=Wyeomyia smithii TaxID=174621 RepID=UPI002467CAED|nr:uncharacterized protein LOC129718884 [Wyeomyia smithii]